MVQTRRLLAQEYFPDAAPHAAVERLRRWIDSDRKMRHALIKAGYQSRQRSFNCKQMAVFRRYFG